MTDNDPKLSGPNSVLPKIEEFAHAVTEADAPDGSWQRITELLNDALDLEGEARRSFLDRLRHSEPDFCQRVEELLSLEEDSEDFLAEPIFSLHASLDIQNPIGRRIGAYELVGELGRGGMGAVFLAERKDGEFEQQVAIKILKRGMDTEEIVRRFHTERQILAGLKHPNIAPLFDGGTTDDGLPYLVMEFVDGVPVDVYCDRHRLDVRERLDLFLKICDAVRRAHQNLVVHRDLKPANILVTAEGQPKLLDFGIAKLLGDGPHGIEQLTRTSLPAPLTPNYASPEQIRGNPITTASDVYALGVLLYELLCGHRPYRIDTGTPRELEDAICDQVPHRPSTAVSKTREIEMPDGSTRSLRPNEISLARSVDPKRLRRQLVGDLDTIVLRALRKEPERRFPSVEQLAEDLRRYLEGLPILSREDSWTYRSGKFIRRHAVGVATVAVVVVLILGFAISTSIQSREIQQQNSEIEQQRDEIEKEQVRFEQINEFLMDMLTLNDPSRAKGETLTVREALDRAYENLQQDQLAPEQRANFLETVGLVYLHLNIFGEARESLEEALKIRRELAADQTDRLVASSLQNLASLEREEGAEAKAQEMLVEALEIERSLSPEGSLALAKALNNRASYLRNTRKYDEAEPLAREGLHMKQDLEASEAELGYSYNTLAAIQHHRGEYEEALELYRKTEEIRRRDQGGTPSLANTLNNIGALLSDRMGRPEEAIPFLEEALDLRRKLFSGPHIALVSSLHNTAIAYLLIGKVDMASKRVEEAFQVLDGLSEGTIDRLHPILVRDQAFIYEARGSYRECERVIEDAALECGIDGEETDACLESRSLYGACLAGQGRVEEGRPWLEASLAGLEVDRVKNRLDALVAKRYSEYLE